MTSRTAPVVALLVALLVASAAPGTVVAAEDPRFEVTVPEPRLQPGATQEVTVHLTNDAADVDERVTTASNVRVTASAGATPFTVVSGPRLVGTMDDGATRDISFRIEVPSTTPGGTYRIPLEVTYEYDGDERARQMVYAVVHVPERPIFTVDGVTSNLVVGETGRVTVTMTNVGSRAATASTLALTAPASALSLGGTQSTTAYVGAWAPNETRQVTFAVSATEAAIATEYALTLQPSYRDANDVATTAPAQSIGVTPAPEQAFGFADVSVDLRGTSAVLTAEVTNEGDRAVEDAVVTLESLGPSVTVREPTAPIGALAPGESATVAFDLGVAPEAAPGPRQFDARVRYDRGRATTYQSDAVALRADFPTGEKTFSLQPVNATFGIDTTNRFTVRVTNTGDEPLTDVRAMLAPTPPYQSQSPSAYVGSLAPGESAVVTFEVTTPEDAVPTRDAMTVNLTADTPNDQTVRSGPHLVPFTVAEPGSTTSNTTALAAGAVLVIVLLGAGWWWLNRT